MNINLKAACVLAVVALFGFGAQANAQLTITEIMYNPLTDNDGEYSWFEVRNDGMAAIDLDGAQVEEDGAFYRSSFSRSIVASDQVGTTTTTILPGEIAVLYDGWFGSSSPLTHNADEFRTAWNVPASVPVISVNFFPGLSNSGDTFGIWATDADVLADSTETAPASGDFNVTSFNNTIATVTYDTVAPWPGSSNGVAIQWDGTNSALDGGSWYQAGSGEPNSSTSNAILSDQAGLKNNTSDFASPGLVPAAPTTATGLLITEIMNDPASNEDDWEWVEIYNATGSTIDFSSTPYVIDDGNNNDVTAANINSGSIAAGTAAVLFNAEDNNITDLQAAWGASINFIPVDEWGQMGLNNGQNSSATDEITDGYNDQVTIWDNFTTYEADRLAGNRDNALISVEFSEIDVDADPGTTADNWPVNPGNSASLYLTDLDLDPNLGNSWGLSGDLNDFDGYNATGVPTEGNEVFYPGGGVGSPGFFTAFVPPTILEGDFNDDGTVDAADYTIWRDNLGGDASTLNGNGDGDSDVDIDDYNLWAGNFGASSSSSAASAVPEPTAALLMLCGVAGLVTRRNG